ncbi:MAG: PTS mannose transporter subunit IID [Hespellia sp.]|nr:PTS mannose transporter subunit IID [Hespellia sp.]
MITITQAILLGLACAVTKCCIPYTIGGFAMNTVVFNAAVIGVILGDVPQAMIVGAALQLVYLGLVSSGGNMPQDPCFAAYFAIPIVVATGADTNTAIALAVPIGILGPQLTNLCYVVNGFYMEKCDAFAEKGEAGGIVRWGIIFPILFRIVLFTIPLALGLYFGSGVLQNILNSIPQAVLNGFSAIGSCLPAVGFAIIASLISKPKYVPFFFAGFFLIQYSKIGTIPLMIAGAFITFLYITFTANEYIVDKPEAEEMDATLEVSAEQKLGKGDLFKAWTVWWLFCEVGHNFVRMQASSFCVAVSSALKKFYPNPEDKPGYADALKRNMIFFNTEGHWGGGPCLGLTLALEEKRSQDPESLPGDMILNVKTGLMGPLAGLGDTITWSTLMYLLIGICLPMANAGNVLGGLLPPIILAVICFIVGYLLTNQCYKQGYKFAEDMLKSGLVDMIIAAASVLGLFMMGGLTASFVVATTPIEIVTDTYTTSIQSALDAIIPGAIPLVIVLFTWKYISKTGNYFKVTIGLTLVAFVLGCFGLIV